MSIKYKPLPDNCTIAKSSIHGLGLFALKPIVNGHDFGITHVKDDEFQDGYIRLPIGGFFNHSEDPNCKVVKDGRFLRLIVIRDIKQGEEITACYNLYNPKE